MMKKGFCTLFLVLSLVTLARSQGSLLEMSQDLWSKLLAGGLTKVGKLDPLRVPVVKVDQSEGNTSYRMILRNVEIMGLNNSTLESIHIARGRLKSNLSELEAGYVSYSDLRDLDAIRYRFHTLLKEPKSQSDSFEAIVSATNQDNKFRTEESSSRFRDSRLERLRQYDPFLLKIQGEEMKEERTTEQMRSEQKSSGYGTFSMEGARVMGRKENSRTMENARYPSDVQLIYALSAMNSGSNIRNDEQGEDTTDCSGSCQGRRGSFPARSGSVAGENGRKENVDDRRFSERLEDAQGSASEYTESKVKSPEQRIIPGFVARDQVRQRYEESASRTSSGDQPGYIDIVYADGQNNGSVKRFGNVRMNSKSDAMVYGLQDVMKAIRENRKFATHNFTEGVSLMKRNDAIRTAMEGKRVKDLIRYANDYQEQQGYFEEGVQLVYHYGGMEAKISEDSKTVRATTRQKRAHQEEEAEDDVMHVILKVRVPLLRIKSEYQLMGKVGREILRGNGQLNGNFTELIGDFTLELKKVNNQLMIVRAARSKLVAKDQNITLQGMDEQGPVASILTHGLMAAEAVAAMLADDLATKALNEKTADAMIYRMYKNLPAN